MAETTIDEVGEGTIAKYKLTAEMSGVALQSADSWVFSVTGTKGTVEISSTDTTNVINKTDHYVVFIDTSKTGTGVLKGRVRMEIVDTDYTDANGGNIRPEVSLAFEVLKVS